MITAWENFILVREQSFFTFKYVELRGGDYTEVVPPVPIPNTEVKYLKADDSVFTRK